MGQINENFLKVDAMIKLALKKIKKQGFFNSLIRFSWRAATLRLGLIDKAIKKKWADDRNYLPLSQAHYSLYKTIHIDYYEILGGFPNLRDPRTFNDKIQWLKLFDQDSLKVQCADKLGLRSYIEQRTGNNKHLPKLYFAGSQLTHKDIDDLPRSFVLKTNHDSGSVFLIRNKNDVDWTHTLAQLEASISRIYGEKYGEWMYRYISPKIFAEELLGSPENNVPPADYKFHCSDGRVRFLQYIWDRGKNTKEVITDRSGVVMRGVHLDRNFILGDSFERPPQFSSLIELSELLSKGFKYVRVDLYLISGSIYVGELTFLPFRGCYLGNGQKKLGELIIFDKVPSQLFTPDNTYQ